MPKTPPADRVSDSLAALNSPKRMQHRKAVLEASDQARYGMRCLKAAETPVEQDLRRRIAASIRRQMPTGVCVDVHRNLLLTHHTTSQVSLSIDVAAYTGGVTLKVCMSAKNFGDVRKCAKRLAAMLSPQAS